MEDVESSPDAKGESSDSSISATSEDAAAEVASAPESSPAAGGDSAEDIEAWLALVCRNIDSPEEEAAAESAPEEPKPEDESAKIAPQDPEPTEPESEPEPQPEPEPEPEKEPEKEPEEPQVEKKVEQKTKPDTKSVKQAVENAEKSKAEVKTDEPELKLVRSESEADPRETVDSEESQPELKLVRPTPEDSDSSAAESAPAEAEEEPAPATQESEPAEEEPEEGLKLVREPAIEEPPRPVLGAVPAVVLDSSQAPEESAELGGAPQDVFGAPEPASDDLFSGPAQAVEKAPLMGGGAPAVTEVDDIFNQVSEPPVTELEEPLMGAQPATELRSYETVSFTDTAVEQAKSQDTMGMPTEKEPEQPSSGPLGLQASVEKTSPFAAKPKSFDTIGMGPTTTPKTEPAEAPQPAAQNESSETLGTDEAPKPEPKSYETMLTGDKPEASKPGSKSYETVLDFKKPTSEKAPAAATPTSGITLDAELLKSTRKPDKAEEAQTFQKTGQSKVAPGSSLKFLEQALAKSVPGKLPEGLKKRSVTAIRYVFTKGSVQRAAVIAENDQGKLEALAVGGFSPDLDSMAQIPERLLRATKTSGKPLLMVDCIRDPRFAKDPVVTKFEVRSVACIPFTDKETGSRGFLYLDNCTAPNAFSYQDLEELTNFAYKLATQTDLSEYEVSAPVSTGSDELTVEVQPFSPWWFVGAIVAAIILITPALYNTFTKDDAPKRAQTSTTSQPIENPAAVIQGFIRSLDAKSYEGAYSYLSQDLQSKISQEQFDKKLKKDMEKYDKAWRLSRVNIRGGNLDQESLKSFRVTVGHSGPWIWTLQKTDGKWYLHEFEGGLSIP